MKLQLTHTHQVACWNTKKGRFIFLCFVQVVMVFNAFEQGNVIVYRSAGTLFMSCTEVSEYCTCWCAANTQRFGILIIGK